MVAGQAKAIPDSGDSCFLALSTSAVGKPRVWGQLSLSLFFFLLFPRGMSHSAFLPLSLLGGWGWAVGVGPGMFVCLLWYTLRVRL